jgi:hypothetical protein
MKGEVMQVATTNNRYDIGTFRVPPTPIFTFRAGSVPAGIRMRAINAAGVAVASSQRTLIVP